MKYSLAIVTSAVLAVAAASVSLPIAANETGDETVRPVISVKLPNVPGKSLSAALVTYPPGGKSGETSPRRQCVRVRCIWSDPVRKLGDGTCQSLQSRRSILRASEQRASRKRERQRNRAREPPCCFRC